ncbi:glycylpeptide N-tetradecanoyltransferase 2-like [Saccostrea echinata]|uniref:glycylpeptide N-tetradecanoyltransferase 2-like n=1 Tax=Saccostrea echinata TaxID=191078 RepID=UPI002A83C500|nr:glycylpeptide N-tetradecanoyltransferase 2-like [Saccostrea echinata]
MADVDSLHDLSSDQNEDQSAVDADVEEDEVSERGEDPASRKKHKKFQKKRRHKDIERSSGDSVTEDDEVNRPDPLPVIPNDKEQQQSGMEADYESQDTGTKQTVQDSKKKVSAGAEGPIPSNAPESSLSGLQKIQKAVELLSMSHGAPKSMEEATKKRYKFWETQPVPEINEKIQDINQPIEEDKPVEEIRTEPYSLPSGFIWDTLDLLDPLILKELYTLLNENYVEDDDNMFRFDYSPEFLQWALQPPGWCKDWHCGVRVAKSGKLVGFISAVPALIKMYDKKKHMVEINFLCVHKKLRSKRVAPVLIREITRRVNLKGLFQAVYTAGVVLPKPVACCRYWHRSLNPRKLIAVKFSHLTRNMTMQRTLKLYKLPENPKTPGFRKFTPADVPESFELLKKYLDKFDLSPTFSIEEFRHWFIPRPGIVDSYVVEKNGTITDFVSFYTLPSTVMHHPQYKMLKAAYSFYNVSMATPWVDLMQDALIVARNMEFDVFNALDLMENKEFLEKLKFGIGDGNLQYYLYNWRCPQMQPQQVGLVLH